MDQEREVSAGIREGLLSLVVVLGLALLLSTEALSLFGALQRPWVALYWIAVFAAGGSHLRRFVRSSFGQKRQFDPIVALCCAAIGGILLLTGITAWFSPPNSSDAMAYHLPRVLYWAQQGSVRFFPTQYLNQIMLQPLAEYAMLHLYLLADSDRLINFVQWGAAFGSIVGVSAVAGLLGANPRGQAIAALFCATLPAGILAASGAKNEWVLALWLICAAFFAIRFNTTGQRRDAALLGIAMGCALLTKATAYLFLPPLLVAVFLGLSKIAFQTRIRGTLLALAFVAGINAPHYTRNYDLSGSILGFDSAQGDSYFRWRNETFGWKQTVSNALRHLSEQLGARNERWNQGVFEAVLSLHSGLKINPNDPGTTWPGEQFTAPKNANHESNTPNRWHLLALLALCCLLPRRTRTYAAGVAAGFVAFCFYLKWQPFMARMLLPLFVVSAPLAGVVRFPSAFLTTAAQLGLCLLLLDSARLPALQNWVRPLEGPQSVISAPRDDQSFSDLGRWMNQESYETSAALLAASKCRTVGIDITNLQLEYPLMALLREKVSDAAFIHTGVENASKRYRQPSSEAPCAVVCLDCMNDAARTSHYSNFARSIPVDRFVVYLQ